MKNENLKFENYLVYSLRYAERDIHEQLLVGKLDLKNSKEKSELAGRGENHQHR